MCVCVFESLSKFLINVNFSIGSIVALMSLEVSGYTNNLNIQV